MTEQESQHAGTTRRGLITQSAVALVAAAMPLLKTQAADTEGRNLLVLNRQSQQITAFTDSRREIGRVACGAPHMPAGQKVTLVSHARNKGFYLSV